MDIKKYQNIFVYGDSGRGKTTLSKKIAAFLGYPVLHLDKVYWEVWLEKQRDREEQESMIRNFIEENNKWVIEGCTRTRHKQFLGKLDLVIYLRYKNILDQLRTVRRRAVARNEPLKQFVPFAISLVKKYYRLGKYKKKPTFLESIAEYRGPIVEMASFEEVDKFVEKNLK